MTKRQYIILVTACVLASFAGSMVINWSVNGEQAHAQTAIKYGYLSKYYNSDYIPTFAEWQATNLTADLNCESALTEKLIRTTLRCMVQQNVLRIYIDTRTQPSWDYHIGRGRFNVSDRELRTAYTEAANYVLSKIIMTYFPEGDWINESAISIKFYIRAHPVGEWKNGVFKLEGE